MGPRRLRRGNQLNTADTAAHAFGFNGAAPVKARKPPSTARPPGESSSLQWGRAG